MTPIAPGDIVKVCMESHARNGWLAKVIQVADQTVARIQFVDGRRDVMHINYLVGAEPHDVAASQLVPKHSHYFKSCPFESIDIYRVLSLFAVADPCLQHAVKKLLVAGGRGHKDISKDVQEAIDTLERWKAMRAEESQP
jgi:hypothetical protein